MSTVVENEEVTEELTEEEGEILTKDKQSDFIDKTLAELHGEEPPAAESEEDETKTPVGDDKDSADDAATEDKSGEDQPNDAEPDWLDDDLKGVVSALGISDQQIAGFQSREELDRALSLLDQAAMNAGKAQAAGDKAVQEETPTEETGKAESKAQTRAPDGKFVKKTEPIQSDYKVQLDPESYDAEVVKEFENLRDHYEGRLVAVQQEVAQRLSRLEQADQDRAAQAEQQQFDSIVDSIGQSDLFGETGKETKDQLANRRKLFDAHQVYQTGLRALGREGQTDRAFVERAFRMEFADVLNNQQRKRITERVKSQSSRRLGIGSVASRDKPFDGPIEDDPELHRAFKKMSQES
jgi:hypothetical protein